jgi:hypothetical protein
MTSIVQYVFNRLNDEDPDKVMQYIADYDAEVRKAIKDQKEGQ